VKPYLSIVSSRFRTLLQYRAAAMAGVVTQIFFGLIRVMIYDAFYASSSVAQPMSADQVITYVWLGQAMLMLVLFHVDPDVAEMMRSGNVSYELTRPLDLYSLWFSRCLSGRAAPLLLRSIPIFVVAGLFLGLGAPASSAAFGLFVASSFLALLFSAAVVTLLTISLLWTLEGDGVRYASGLIFFFSGIVVPLPLFPDWMQGVIAVLPFRGLIDTPFRIYIGQLHGTAALSSVALQIAWLAAFVVAGRMMLARGLRRLVVQGG
jgi:ABC-2 type transport system permease protein